MGLFLHGKWMTVGTVFLAFVLSIHMAAFYIYSWAKRWTYPTILTKVVSVFGMLFWIMFGLQSLATCHSIHQKVKTLSFGRWSIIGLVSIGFDILFFSMFINYDGFDKNNCSDADDEASDHSMGCNHKKGLVGMSVAIFASAIYRLLVILIVWHWDVRWNQTAAPVNNAPTPATPAGEKGSSTKAQSLPKVRRGRRGGVPAIAITQHEEQEEAEELVREGGSETESGTESEGEEQEMVERDRRRRGKSRYDV